MGAGLGLEIPVMYQARGHENLTLNLAGTFFTDRKSGGGRCAEVTVIRGSTVHISDDEIKS